MESGVNQLPRLRNGLLLNYSKLTGLKDLPKNADDLKAMKKTLDAGTNGDACVLAGHMRALTHTHFLSLSLTLTLSLTHPATTAGPPPLYCLLGHTCGCYKNHGDIKMHVLHNVTMVCLMQGSSARTTVHSKHIHTNWRLLIQRRQPSMRWSCPTTIHHGQICQVISPSQTPWGRISPGSKSNFVNLRRIVTSQGAVLDAASIQ